MFNSSKLNDFYLFIYFSFKIVFFTKYWRSVKYLFFNKYILFLLFNYISWFVDWNYYILQNYKKLRMLLDIHPKKNKYRVVILREMFYLKLFSINSFDSLITRKINDEWIVKVKKILELLNVQLIMVFEIIT